MEILEIISGETVTATELAQRMNISKAAISKNLHILEKANIISFKKNADSRKSYPVMNIDQINIHFPQKIFPEYLKKAYDIPIGNYFAINHVVPSCGLSSESSLISKMDDVNAFSQLNVFVHKFYGLLRERLNTSSQTNYHPI